MMDGGEHDPGGTLRAPTVRSLQASSATAIGAHEQQ